MGNFKPLLPLGKSTVVETAVESFLGAGIEDIRVVLGHRADEVAPVVAGHRGVTFLPNQNYAEGMFSSVQTGVSSLGPEVEAFFMLPADNPLIKRRTLVEIIRVYCETGAAIVYPCFAGERGHPPLITARFAGSILNWSRPGGLQALLREHETEAVEVEVPDQGVLMDMDTPEDYRMLAEYHYRRDIPTVQECSVILKKYNVQDRVEGHCRAVANMAERLTFLLNGAGCNINSDLVTAAGLLHDLAREKPDHAAAGASILRELGFPRAADIVASHMDITLSGEIVPGAAEIVYLADKMIKGETPVTLEDRLGETMISLAGNPEASQAAEQRLRNAQVIKARIEALLGMPLEKAVNIVTKR
jgi:CTP:molybdopterin cytidylyltransferase MocA